MAQLRGGGGGGGGCDQLGTIPPDPMIPNDLVREILSRLPVKSLMRMKSVCRTWQSIIRDPSFAEAYQGGFSGFLICGPNSERLTTYKQFFQLRIDGDGDGDGPLGVIDNQHQVYHWDKSNNDNKIKIMGYTNVVNGLVCLYDGNHSFLYNVATRENIQLPDSSNESQDCTYHLGFDPVDKLYKLLKLCVIYVNVDYSHDFDFFYDGFEVNFELAGYLDCEILTVGVDSSWRTFHAHPPKKITSPSVCLDGVLYWIDENDYNYPQTLTAFHLAEETFQFITLPSPTAGKGRYYLASFAPSLVLMSKARGWWSRSWWEQVIFRDSRGTMCVGKEREFRLPSLDPHKFIPEGILPDGKVVIMARYPYDPRTMYLFDKEKEEFEKISLHIETPELFAGIGYHHGACYRYQDNIISLSQLLSRASNT